MECFTCNGLELRLVANCIARKFHERVPIVYKTARLRSPWMRYAKRWMYALRQITNMSMGGEHTVTSRRRLRYIGEEGYAQQSTIKLVMNKERASLTVG